MCTTAPSTVRRETPTLLSTVVTATLYVLPAVRSRALTVYGPAASAASSQTTHWSQISGNHLRAVLRATVKSLRVVMLRPWMSPFSCARLSTQTALYWVRPPTWTAATLGLSCEPSAEQTEKSPVLARSRP